jgi:CheY-like chemotaxis protein
MTRPDRPGAKRRLSLLLVDDFADARMLFGDLLQLSHFDVLEAGSGAAALSAAIERRVDVVIVDLGLPDFDGLEVARRLRADPRTAGIAVILLTASDDDSDLRERARLAGCAEVLCKPCTAVELSETLCRLGIDS